MEVLAQVGGSAYAFVALLIGSRLILLWRRTRGIPELLIGVSVLFLAGLGYPLSAAAREALDLALPIRNGLGAFAGLLGAIGIVANSGFTWVLFRREERWATVLVVLLAIVSAGLYVTQTILGDWAHGQLFWGLLPGSIALSYGWACFECARYHVLLRRRLSLGLVDPVIADRFGLYAVATALAVAINLVGWVYFWMGIEMLTHPVGGAMLFVFGTASSALMLLAFIPPRAYVARVRARWAQTA